MSRWSDIEKSGKPSLLSINQHSLKVGDKEVKLRDENQEINNKGWMKKQ